MSYTYTHADCEASGLWQPLVFRDHVVLSFS